MNNSLAEKIMRIAWYFLIALLPITSMPLVARILGADSVASPAILFLFFLILAWAACGWTIGVSVNQSVFGLILFVGSAILSSLLSLFYDLPLFKEIGYLPPMISAVSTLIIGFLFFTSAARMAEENVVRVRSFRLINYSGLILLVWCGAQAISWYSNNSYPDWMFEIQSLFSRRVLYRQRVTGFALEPSWLAHQLNLLYLPYWLASTLTKTTNHKFRLLGFTLENFLLAGGVLMLGLTLSRVGFAAFFMILIITAGIIHSRIVSGIHSWFLEKTSGKLPLKLWMVSTAVLLVYILALVAVIFTYSRIDPRMAELFNINLGEDNPLLRYFDALKFGERVIYWLAGWNIFNDYPLLGVGLGNAGFFFPEKIPAFGWSLVEVRELIYRESFLLNTKNYWIRLLAETGIVGFSLFVGWLLSLIPEMIRKYRSGRMPIKTIGLMGFFTLAALIFEGFSIDSFAMPYWWISLGIAVSSNKS